MGWSPGREAPCLDPRWPALLCPLQDPSGPLGGNPFSSPQQWLFLQNRNTEQGRASSQPAYGLFVGKEMMSPLCPACVPGEGESRGPGDGSDRWPASGV